MAMCIFVGCTSVQKPFSSVAFFNLPKDSRRVAWIQNSGNKQLLSLPDAARRVVCEKHFKPSSLRKQFHRTILCRGAVPEKWCHNSANSNIYLPLQGEPNIVDEQCYEQPTNGETIETWQSGYEDSTTDDTECQVIEITLSDSSEQSQPDSDIEDVSVEYINDENRQIDEEDSQLLEPISTDNNSQDQFVSTFYEDADHTDSKEQESEIVDTKLSPECEIKPAKIRKRLLDEESVLHEDINHCLGESTVCEVVVSSSSVKSNETQIHIGYGSKFGRQILLTGVNRDIAENSTAKASICQIEYYEIFD